MKQMQSEIAEFHEQIDRHEDLRLAYVLVQRRIREFRARGTDVPSALLVLERHLLQECFAESQGR